WFFTWGPLAEKEQVAAEAEDVRQRFRLLNNREGWRERPPETVSTGASSACPVRYRLAYVKEMWRPEKDPKPFDPSADLVLIGHDPTQKAHAGKAATLRVLLLPKQPD